MASTNDNDGGSTDLRRSNMHDDSYQRLRRLQAATAVTAALGPDAEYEAWERTGRVRQGPDVPAYVEAEDVMRAVVCAACQHGDHDERAAGSGERCVCMCHGERPPGYMDRLRHPDCPTCALPETFKPTHDGSSQCESGSIASGGQNSHCSCDLCF